MADLLNNTEFAKALLDDVAAFEAKMGAMTEQQLERMAARTQENMALVQAARRAPPPPAPG